MRPRSETEGGAESEDKDSKQARPAPYSIYRFHHDVILWPVPCLAHRAMTLGRPAHAGPPQRSMWLTTTSPPESVRWLRAWRRRPETPTVSPYARTIPSSASLRGGSCRVGFRQTRSHAIN